MTIQNGQSCFFDFPNCRGGAGIIIDRSASVTLISCTLRNNRAELFHNGGAIENDNGILTLTDCTLSDNYGDGGAGAIENSGTITLTNCTLSGNSTCEGAGAIENSGTITFTDCTLSGNSAENAGGAIINSGTMMLTHSSVGGNDASEWAGGAIANSGAMTLIDCTLNGNSGYIAGAIENGGTMELTNCTLNNNQGAYGVGAIGNRGTMTLTNCTLNGNGASDFDGGAIENSGTMTLADCTLSGNDAGPEGSGGGIANAGTVTLINCTVAGNSAQQNGGGLENRGTATLINTLMANNTAYHESDYRSCAADLGCPENCAGNSIVDAAESNLSSDETCFPAPNISINVRLAPLGYYGGPNQMMALCTAVGIPDPLCSGASPAIDAGDDSINLTTDQRGLPRQSGRHVDVGAYEVQPQDRVQVCIGDCNDDRQVTVNEIMTLVNIALGSAQPLACPNRVADVDISLIIQAVNSALDGCSR